MCCSGSSCGNHACRCICFRCRGCGTCGGDDSAFGSGLAMALMTGAPRQMMSSVSKTKSKAVPLYDTKDQAPPEIRPKTQQTTSQSSGLVNTAKNGCAQQ